MSRQPLFAEFSVDAQDLIDFAITQPRSRVDAFFRAWEQFGILAVEDLDVWLEQLAGAYERLTGTPGSIDPDRLEPEFPLWQVAAQGPSGFPIVPAASLTAERVDLDVWEHSAFARTPGAVVIHPPNTALQITRALGPAMRASAEVQIVDRYLVSSINGKDLDRRALAEFLRDHSCGSVMVVCASDEVIKHYRGSKLRSHDDQRRASERCVEDEIASVAGLPIGYYGLPWDEIVHRCHDRFISFACRESNARRAVQVGIGVGAFADKTHPITLSRVSHDAFATMWGSLTHVLPRKEIRAA